MPDLVILSDRCRRALDEGLERVRARPLTAATRAQQIQAISLLRTLEEWRRRPPYPEQPARFARLARDLTTEVLGAHHPRARELQEPVEAGSASTASSEPALATPGAVTLRICLPCRRASDGDGAACEGCGGALTGFEVASLVDRRFLRTRELGRGGMGVVFEAIDIFLERDVALKFVVPTGGPRAAVMTGFRREAAALAAIRNDHVVQVYTFGIHDGAYYLAMERVVGRDLELILDDHARHGSTLPVPLAVSILGRVASGLDAAHAAGVLHRDLKPSNILIEERTGRAVLVDFGLALRKRSEADASDGPVAAGTPLYLAPELVGGAVSSSPEHWNAPDVYALGCTAFEMLTGRPPFLAAEVADLLEMRVAGPPPRASTVRPGVAAFDDVLLAALARDPRERTTSALEVAAGLERALRAWLTPEPTLPALGVPDASRPPVLVAETDGYHEGARVLIVDDDDVFRRVASRCAQLAFFQCPVRIEAVGSSDAAIECARRGMPDLVVLDYGLPGEDGVDTLTRLRALPGGDRARVVVVSGSVSSVEQWRFQALGVTDFVAKPVRFPALVELIGDIAARAGWQNAIMAPRPATP